MKKSTILVTGGAGYIGSQVVFLLAHKGYDVLVIDHAPAHKRNLIEHARVQYIWGDYADTVILKKICSEFNIEAVMHFAAFIEVGESVKDPHRYYENNVVKTAFLLSVMRDCGINKFIFSSSCAVYGIPVSLPLTEEHQRLPVSPYGKNKMIVEMMLEDYARAYGIRYVALRYFNAAGAAHGLGELHDPESHIIPLALRAAYNDQIFTVFGTDYATSDGTCVRDYLHVLDLADAHGRALEYLETHDESIALNLGTGHGYSVKEVLGTVEQITGMRIHTVAAARRAGDPHTLVAQSQKAYEYLGWQPHHSSLEYIIETAHDFYRNQRIYFKASGLSWLIK